MQIVLIRKDEISKTVLPSKVSGQHRVFFNVKGDNKPLFAVSANATACPILCSGLWGKQK